MKKSLLILALSILTTACSIVKMEPNEFKYSPEMAFTIKYANKTKTTEGMGHNSPTYIAKKGGRFVNLHIQFTNNSNEKQEIDFRNFILVDDAGTRYQPEYAVKTGKVYMGGGADLLTSTIKPGKKRVFIVQYGNSFPKDQQIHRILVKEKLLEF